ncbi:MAG: alpha-amylase family glycosyl hydrolase [Candidatus Latescibacterota bacterium]
MARQRPLQWWQTGVFYNVYVRSFRDTNGDGVGDLTGVIEKLEYLDQVLGVDVLWLKGMLQSPWKEFGFDVSDYTAVHPAMGTLETFDELVRQAHGRGLRVVIDYVVNHSSEDHPWFLESRSSRHNPRRNWYLWRDPAPDGSPPNNWQSVFGGSAWEWDVYTHQYYLHTFLKEQPDLNWREPGVEEAMFAQARFWLDRGVDGFRVDAAHHVMKHPRLSDNPPGKPRSIGGKHLTYDYQVHVHDREHPDLHAVFRRFRRLLDGYGARQPRAAFAEVHPAGGWPAWAQYYGSRGRKEFHFPLNNGFIGVPWEAARIRRVVDSAEAALPPAPGPTPTPATTTRVAWPPASGGRGPAARPCSC